MKEARGKEVPMSFIAQTLAKMITYNRRADQTLGPEKDPANQYYLLLKKFGIDFSRHEPVSTSRSAISRNRKKKITPSFFISEKKQMIFNLHDLGDVGRWKI